MKTSSVSTSRTETGVHRLPMAVLMLLRSPSVMNRRTRTAVRTATRELCARQQWVLVAIDVARTHVRLVIEGRGTEPDVLTAMVEQRLRQVAGLEQSATVPARPLYSEEEMTAASCEVLFEDSLGPYVVPSTAYGRSLADERVGVAGESQLPRAFVPAGVELSDEGNHSMMNLDETMDEDFLDPLAETQPWPVVTG